MSVTFESIEAQAISLAPEDRAKLAESLLESLHTSIADIEGAWAREIEARTRACERGELETISADDVFAEARRRTR